MGTNYYIKALIGLPVTEDMFFTSTTTEIPVKPMCDHVIVPAHAKFCATCGKPVAPRSRIVNERKLKPEWKDKVKTHTPSGVIEGMFELVHESEIIDSDLKFMSAETHKLITRYFVGLSLGSAEIRCSSVPPAWSEGYDPDELHVLFKEAHLLLTKFGLPTNHPPKLYIIEDLH